jgi:asparagine N-glycosylation enzyme membrane subunit Stt3
VNDEMTPGHDESRQALRRDRQKLRQEGRTGGFRRWLRDVPSRLFDVLLEIVGELVLVGLAALVSFLVYGEVRWLFVAAVWIGVNATLVVIALVALLWRRRRSR